MAARLHQRVRTPDQRLAVARAYADKQSGAGDQNRTQECDEAEQDQALYRSAVGRDDHEKSERDR